MPRTKEFDPEAALQTALELFWRRGFVATSTADLVEHLGIGRASIYATFGNKHELYLKALQRYQEQLPDLLRELSQPGPVLPAVTGRSRPPPGLGRRRLDGGHRPGGGRRRDGLIARPHPRSRS